MVIKVGVPVRRLRSHDRRANARTPGRPSEADRGNRERSPRHFRIRHRPAGRLHPAPSHHAQRGAQGSCRLRGARRARAAGRGLWWIGHEGNGVAVGGRLAEEGRPHPLRRHRRQHQRLARRRRRLPHRAADRHVVAALRRAAGLRPEPQADQPAGRVLGGQRRRHRVHGAPQAGSRVPQRQVGDRRRRRLHASSAS